MKKAKKPDFLDIEDNDERKKAIEAALNEMNERGVALGEPDAGIRAVVSRYSFSVTIILWATIIGTLALSASAIYFSFLPSPFSYISTQDGKLYEIHPVKREK